MPKALVVSDEVDERLWTDAVRAHDVDLVIGAGDLPFDYLAFLAGATLLWALKELGPR